MASRVRLLVGGGLTYLAAVAVGYSYATSNTHGCKAPGHHDHNPEVYISDENRHQTYAKNAKKYDNGKNFHHFLNVLF
jgi:hypothetical protein